MTPKAPAEEIRVGNRRVAISRRDKVLFPDDGITKGDLVEFYAGIAPKMVPYTRDRPLTLERYPDGLRGERIFQKNASKYFPEWIPRGEVRKKDGAVTHVLANDAATLAYLANQAVITHHVWLSTMKQLHKPDQLIFDLDPSGEDFDEVRETALGVRELLTDLGLVPFVKTTGSRGLHVVVPLRPSETYDEVWDFAHAVAERMVAEKPKVLTLEFMKAKRRGRLFLDINRNAYAQTAVAPFSVRPLPGAPVAVTLDWSDVENKKLRPNGFSMSDALKRDDAWEGFRKAARSLSPAIKRIGRDGD
ncbi:MAG: non-homologous end-joining DNA ligase [Actinomycetota bacterium]